MSDKKDKNVMPPPYKNKSIEFIRLIPRRERKKAIKNAHFNTFSSRLRAKDVYIDFLTDSGTTAMSDQQWAGMMLGDESYAGSENFYHFEKAVQDVFGYKYIVPTHQGRGAEHIIAQIMIPEGGGFIPNNLYFTTSRFHQEYAGGKSIDVGIYEARDPHSAFPFKGNMDTELLFNIIKNEGSHKFPFVRIEASLNMAGGQPFSMANLKEVSRICRTNKIFLLLDATRLVENAYFIQQKEEGYGRKSLKELVLKICSYTDGCTMSSKKDHYVNTGGFLATNRKDVYEKAREKVICFEGMDTYGGLTGRDMEALSIGIRESVDNEDLVKHYIGQVAYLHSLIRQNLKPFLKREKKLPIVAPSGAHAVFLNAKAFFPHISQEQFPAQTLAVEIYIEGGVRAMERGIVSGQHGDEKYEGLELVRLAIPRRVYELAHLNYVADVIKRVWERRHKVRGLKMIYEPKDLKFFLAKFERI